MDKSTYISVDGKQLNYSYSISCLVCDEPVNLTEEEVMTLKYGHPIHSKMCNKCKQAILRMREELDN